jgi:hypothetical protein
MQRTTRLVRNDDYEPMGLAYQSLLIAGLDQALMENGVTDPALRKAICESYFFWHGNLHDQGWFRRHGESALYPLICFSKKFLSVNTSIDDLGDVYAPCTNFSWHEYSSYERELEVPIESGNIGNEQK